MQAHAAKAACSYIGVAHLHGSEGLLAVPLLDPYVHVLSSGSVFLLTRSISKSNCRTGAFRGGMGWEGGTIALAKHHAARGGDPINTGARKSLGAHVRNMANGSKPMAWPSIEAQLRCARRG